MNSDTICQTILLQFFAQLEFSGISGNLEMSGNLAEVREKAQSQEKVKEFFVLGKFDCGSSTK